MEESGNQKVDINSVPNEILWMILMHIPEDRLQVSVGKFLLNGQYEKTCRSKNERFNQVMLVCKRWKQVIESNTTFHCTFFDNIGIQDDHKDILESQKRFKSFSFTYCWKHKTQLNYFQRSVEMNKKWIQEVTINLYSSRTGDPDFRLLKLHPLEIFSLLWSLEFVTKLKIILYHVEDSANWFWPEFQFQNLKNLDIYFCFSEDKTFALNILKKIRAPNLESFNGGMVSGVMSDIEEILNCLEDVESLQSFHVITSLRKIYWDHETLIFTSLQDDSEKLKRFLKNRLSHVKKVTIENCSGLDWYGLLFPQKATENS
jgi:hypothetical protein